MKKLIINILILITAITGQVSAQETVQVPLDHNRAADDMKFSNGRQFIALKRPEKAKEELEEYLEIFHNGNHRADAYLILGEIAYVNFRYQKALSIYLSLYEESSNTEKGAEALFKIGLCYRKMGISKKAMEIFSLLVSDHPASTFASQARMHMDLLKILEKK